MAVLSVLVLWDSALLVSSSLNAREQERQTKPNWKGWPGQILDLLRMLKRSTFCFGNNAGRDYPKSQRLGFRKLTGQAQECQGMLYFPQRFLFSPVGTGK